MQNHQNKIRRTSIRKQDWGYASVGACFIAICRLQRQPFIGDTVDGVMQDSLIGTMAYVLWDNIKYHAKNIGLGEFVIRPDHVHGILVLMNNGAFNGDGSVGETQALPLRPVMSSQDFNIGKHRFQNQGKNAISSIIDVCQSAVSQYVHRLNFKFERQSRFYDPIIHEEGAFSQISDYIVSKPMN